MAVQIDQGGTPVPRFDPRTAGGALAPGYTAPPTAGALPPGYSPPGFGGTVDSTPPLPPATAAASPPAAPAAAPFPAAPTPSAPGAANDPFAGDPGVLAAQNNATSMNAQIDAWLKQMSQQALIRFGDPALAGEAGFGGDQQSADFAQQNYLSGNSDLARTDHANQLAKRAIINRLAAHGILGSGDLGYQEGEQGRAYGNQVYDLRSTLLNYLQGIRQQALSQKTGSQANVTSAYQTAYQNAIQNYMANLAAWAAQQQQAQGA